MTTEDLDEERIEQQQDDYFEEDIHIWVLINANV